LGVGTTNNPHRLELGAVSFGLGLTSRKDFSMLADHVRSLDNQAMACPGLQE
jgi:hypothetical protein